METAVARKSSPQNHPFRSYPLVYRTLSGLIKTKCFQFIKSFELLNNPEVRKDYYHDFKMRRYQLKEVKLLVGVHTATKRRRQIPTQAFSYRDQFFPCSEACGENCEGCGLEEESSLGTDPAFCKPQPQPPPELCR